MFQQSPEHFSTTKVAGPAGVELEVAACALGGLAKRRLDVVVASLALFFALPLMLVVAGIVRVSMGSPVIFAQWRVGYAGRLFRCYKFRTMVRDGEAVLQRHFEHSPDAAEEWRANQKLRSDPRVTFIGRLLRKSSLDELPQLINVLRGDMSCVGPRPVLPDELERYGASRQEYLRSRPGLTGLWQVSGRNRLDYASRVTLDRSYVREWTMKRDLLILIKTIRVVINASDTS